MATTRLTKRSVDALPAPPECDYFVWDDTLKGFGVRVTEHAGIVRRAYVVGYRPASGQGFRRHTIGAHGPLTLQEARRRAKRLLADVLEGTDPAETRRQARARRSVREVGEAYLREVGVRRKATTATEYGRLWALHVVPALRRLPWAPPRRRTCGACTRALHATPYRANRVLAMLGAFFSFAEDEGLRERHSNPAHAVKPYPEVPRERFLSAAEVARLGEVLTRAERHGLPAAGNKRRPPPAKKPQNRPKSADTPRRANPFAIAALRLLLLTGCRESASLAAWLGGRRRRRHAAQEGEGVGAATILSSRHERESGRAGYPTHEDERGAISSRSACPRLATPRQLIAAGLRPVRA
ncbi:MAG: DUF4102 domain-containing protein [Gemmatimonadetes bacterium]|nr:DUF4102 domain-containing protein [Gemmatimonadota bacterium]